ncbi:MAG: serine hydrolase [Ardenticatenales bacterium]|nr:serine hydrolase [Ardenticatenales bacterium]
MAKIGSLMLHGGSWDGKQIVSTAWVEASTSHQIDATLQDGYGYQWWVAGDDLFMALGYAGQFIFVVPDKDLVAIFTSHLEDRDFYTPQRLLEDYIIPAVDPAGELPANPGGMTRLEGAIKELANP